LADEFKADRIFRPVPTEGHFHISIFAGGGVPPLAEPSESIQNFGGKRKCRIPKTQGKRIYSNLS
jgi:hypothetical protein